jgi:hypothetical protein
MILIGKTKIKQGEVGSCSVKKALIMLTFGIAGRLGAFEVR